MMEYALWILVSFFAVIGFLFCLIGCLELFSLRKIRSIRRVVLQVELGGKEPQIEFLLNSLSLICDRIGIGRQEAILEILDGGLSSEEQQAVRDYCEKNPWVVFTEG